MDFFLFICGGVTFLGIALCSGGEREVPLEAAGGVPRDLTFVGRLAS